MDFNDADQFRIFERGSILINRYDDEKREIALKVCIPCCILQSILPSITGNGVINNYSIVNPVSVWVPNHGVPIDIDEKLQDVLQRSLDLFLEISRMTSRPADLSPMLPLGVYVIFQLRAKIDDIAKILMEIEDIESPGVPEFRYVLASVLAKVLSSTA